MDGSLFTVCLYLTVNGKKGVLMKKGLVLLCLAGLLSGCAMMGTGKQATDTEGGALLGALAGGIIGNQTGSPLTGALIGAGVGGVAGRSIGGQG